MLSEIDFTILGKLNMTMQKLPLAIAIITNIAINAILAMAIGQG